jgi:hypothetical protein
MAPEVHDPKKLLKIVNCAEKLKETVAGVQMG